MRYITKKLDNDEYEITHIELREDLEGNDVEVIKGRNIVTLDKLEDTITRYKVVLEDQKAKGTQEEIETLVANYKEELESEIELTEQHLESLNKMREAITTG